jgi:hypothetical protein
MEFIIFMIVFAFVLTFIFWLIFRSGKSQPSKKTIHKTKKLPPRKKTPTPAIIPLNPKPVIPSLEFKKKVATELLKRNPEIVTAVIKKWLREK